MDKLFEDLDFVVKEFTQLEDLDRSIEIGWDWMVDNFNILNLILSLKLPVVRSESNGPDCLTI